MATQTTKKRTYPWKTNVDGKTVTLRLMTAEDKDAVLNFARSLPEDDLLFLSFDITDEDFVDAWVKRVKAGKWHTILVEIDGKLVGHGSLMRTDQGLVTASRRNHSAFVAGSAR